MYEEFLNIKYKNRGMCVDEGLDCLTFILYFYKTHLKRDIIVNIPEYQQTWYKNKDTYDLYSKNIDKYINVKRFKDVKYIELYDILFFSVYEDVNIITHAGIYIGNNKIIHCIENKGVVISDLTIMKNKLILYGNVKE